VRRGYAVVVPMRPGFSLSGGVEPSAGCRVQASGEQQAHTVRRTLAWLAARPWADVSRNIVLGQSAGGLVTLAYGTDAHPGTRLLVNFAGGLKLQGCAQWPHNLVQAIADYGQRTPLPSLWFYGDNDSYFPPEVWRAAHQGYSQAGGRAELVAFGTFGHDAHAMFGSREGLAVWVPRLMAALAALGLPSTPLPRLAAAPDIAMPPASGYAQVAELHRVPVRTAPGQAAYQAWLQADRPRAFAVQPRHGAWASAWGGEQPLARALAHCEREAGGAACRLYAVDDTVVWSNE
jgi:dienelactone hydrolase